MKLFRMITACMVGGAMMMTSCSSDDNATDDGQEIESIGVEMTDDPTEDKLGVTINGLTYVFDAAYTGEGAALVRRAVKRVTSIQDAGLDNIIMHTSNISKLTKDELVAIAALVVNGGSLMVVEPLPSDEVTLLEKLLEVTDNCLNGTIKSPLFDDIDYDNLENFYAWADKETNTIVDGYNIKGDDNSLEIVGWRDNKTFKSLNVHEGETYKKELEVTFTNEDGTETTTPVTVDETVEMNDYLFGLQADESAAWMNTTDDVPANAIERAAAVKAIANRANEAEQLIDNLATAQEYDLQIGGIVTFKDGKKTISRYHKVLVNRKVYAAYSFNKKTDYYCVNQTVRLYNQDLKCGPVSEGEWWDAGEWDKWKASTKNHPAAKPRLYGPFLRMFSMEMYVKDARPTIVKSIPVNSTTDGDTNSTGFSVSLGANLGFSGPAPTGGVSASVQWSSSVSRVSPDLQMTTATNTGNGHVSWQYVLNNRPESHLAKAGFSATHTSAKDVATKELELQQSWVWSMQSNDNSIDIVTDWTMTDEWMSYQNTFKQFKTYEYYIDEKFSNTDLKKENAAQEKNFTFDRIQHVACPPRVKENWSMTIEGDGLTGEQKTKVENFLLDHLSQYYTKSFVLFSAKAGHKKALIDGKIQLGTQDELGRRVANLKKASESNTNVAELLRMAGKDAGIAATGSYKIVWRNTDAHTGDTKYENEELTIKLSAN